MNKILILIIAVITLFTPILAQKKSVARKKAPATKPASGEATAKVSVAKNPIAGKFFRTLETPDPKVLEQLLSADFIGTTDDGMPMNKAELLDRFKSGKIVMSNPQETMSRISGATGIVTGIVQWNNQKLIRYTEVWILRQARWQLLSWQATPLNPAYLLAKKIAGGKKVISTDSGLQYIDIVEGTGNSPKQGDRVRVHYTGTLENGTKFDSSVDSNKPFEFQIGVGQVIPGWDEGVMSMKVGGKRKLVIPPQLGYGARGIGPIPPNATLLFDVELLEVK